MKINSEKLTPRSRVLPEKLTVPQLFKTFPKFYGKRRFIFAFTRRRQLSLSWATPFQFTPPSSFLKINFNIILPYNICLPSILFPTGSLHPPPLFFHFSLIPATRPAHHILLDCITQIIFFFLKKARERLKVIKEFFGTSQLLLYGINPCYHTKANTPH